VTDQWRYIALVDEVPNDMWDILVERGWEVGPAPARSRIRLTKRGESVDDHAILRQELLTILERSRTGARVLGDTHQPIPSEVVGTPVEDKLADLTTMHLASTGPISDIPAIFHVPWPGTGAASSALATSSVPGTSSAPAKSDGSAPVAKPAEPTPAASELAELVDKGLPALALPENLWAIYIDKDERADFAKTIAEDLYAARIAYARRVGWVLAPELELLDLLDRLPKDPQVTTSKSMTKAILQARVDTAKSEADLVQKDVELKEELLRQQSQVTQLLAEFLKQAETWRGLAQTGKHFLVGLTFFAMAVTGFLAFLLFDNKLDAWAFPAAVFALAAFAISPAVLLIIERPLKGIDQWMPSGKAQDDQAGKQTTLSADTTGSKASASPAAPGSMK
jgi:hypothetical protein